jgi:hypothetical protein
MNPLKWNPCRRDSGVFLDWLRPQYLNGFTVPAIRARRQDAIRRRKILRFRSGRSAGLRCLGFRFGHGITFQKIFDGAFLRRLRLLPLRIAEAI